MKKKKKLALLLKVGSGKMFFSIDYHFHHHQSMKSSHICRFLIWLQLPHTYQLQQNRCQIEFLLWHMLTFIKTALFNRTQCITVSSLRAQKPAVISDPLTRAFQLDFAVIRRDSEMKRCHHILHKIRSSGRWESNTQVSWAAILLRSNPTQTLCPHCRAVSAHHREAERRGDRKVFRCVGERQEQEDSASIHGFLRHENFSIWEEDGEV